MEALSGCAAPEPAAEPDPAPPPAGPAAPDTPVAPVASAPADALNGHIAPEPDTDTATQTVITKETLPPKEKPDTYIGPLTTEELIKVYDEKEKSAIETFPESIESILLDNVLANLQCADTDMKSPENATQNVNTETNTTEDLLAILEGDAPKPAPASVKSEVKSENSQKVVKPRHRTIQLNPELEKKLALKQLKEFPSGKRKTPKTLNAISDVTIPPIKSAITVKRYTIESSAISEKNDENSTPNEIIPKKDVDKKNIKTYSKKSNDISFIEDDWSDDDNADKSEAVPKKTKCLNTISSQNGKEKTDDSFINPAEISQENLANRRVSRVIKKKIIWDPDNPDSFKLTTVSNKKKSAEKTIEPEIKKTKNAEKSQAEDRIVKENANDNNVTPAKQTNATPGSGKKRKMTEVDKLMMDEGVVNMMHELELSNADASDTNKSAKKSIIPREKRNLIAKAKTVILTKEKKVVRNKQDPSSNGVKISKKDSRVSVGSANEITDAVPDESRIIRRHSSSSFSSGCLSPRPQSPSEVSVSKNVDGKDVKKKKLTTPGKQNESSGIKRKSSSVKIAVAKAKKTDNAKSVDQLDAVDLKIDSNKYSLLTTKKSDNCLYVDIKKHNTQGLFNTKMMKELANVVMKANEEKVRVLAVTSEDGMLCGGLDLHSILQTRVNLQRTNASEILESMRELVMELCRFNGALIFGIDGPCAGFGIALLSLADLVLASDRATFCVAPTYRRQLPPEGISLLNLNNFMSAQLSRELVYCGRKLTASEALHRGIIARTLWPDSFSQEISATAKDIAQHPIQVFNITKSVLRSDDHARVEKVLQDEALHLAEFWCTPSGQEAIRMTHSNI